MVFKEGKRHIDVFLRFSVLLVVAFLDTKFKLTHARKHKRFRIRLAGQRAIGKVDLGFF